ncbi:MAG: hypothetical protein JG781_1219 [Peptococcaceae bacterium]|jgi:membrane-bound serine protease (ClpP class)|nr:hypothetical protein [Peptococcaceae bacterium]
MKRYGLIVYWLITCLLLTLIPGSLLAASTKTVYVIPIRDTIDPGLSKFVARSYAEAEKLKADMVLLEIDTPGGRVDAALQIRDTIRQSSIPTTALVKGGAISAGALITLASKTIAMQPGATIGDAEPRSGSQRADEKFVSYWAKEMAATAEVNGRDPKYAIAMADRDAGVPGLVEKGKLLTLTYQEAARVGYSDYTVNDRNELLTKLGFSDARIIEAEASVSEKLTRFVTNPFVAPFLLTIGIAGIIIEFLTVGWGIAGVIGLVSLALYFGGHLLAGFTGWEAVLLFLLGLILLVVEALVPGFGLPGIGGILSIIASIVLSAPSWEAGVISLVLSLVGTIVLVLLSFKILTKRKFWHRLVLPLKYNKEEGYISQSQDLTKYVGRRGVAYTVLRPAGTVELDDGTRLDVVTEGDFIPKGSKVVVDRVEGIRIIVHALKEES